MDKISVISDSDMSDPHSTHSTYPISLYEWSSILLPGRLYFGAYPTDDLLHQIDVDRFSHVVDLTVPGEIDVPYHTRRPFQVLRFAIQDRSVPEDGLEYCAFVSHIADLLKTDPAAKVFVHCRGGHGRSSMFCVSLWMRLYPLASLHEAIFAVNVAHITRTHLRPKWRNRRIPFNHLQHTFLHRMHKSIYLNTAEDSELFVASHYAWILPRRPNDIVDLYHAAIADGVADNEVYSRVFAALHRRFADNRDLRCRLELTFLKTFKFVGVPDALNEMVGRALFAIRDEIRVHENILRCQ